MKHRLNGADIGIRRTTRCRIGIYAVLLRFDFTQVSSDRNAGRSPYRPKNKCDIPWRLTDGKSNKEAADRLGISSRTAEEHRAEIMKDRSSDPGKRTSL